MNTIQRCPKPRFAFVIEQSLGHVTHYKNLRAEIDLIPQIDVTWYPLGFASNGTLETSSPPRSKWIMQADRHARYMVNRALALHHNDAWAARVGLAARRALAHVNLDQYSAFFFHSHAAALLSTKLMRRVPSIISLDATPINFDSFSDVYEFQPLTGPFGRLKHLLHMRAFHSAHELVTWSEWARQSLITDYSVNPDRVKVIPPGVDLDLWPQPAPREATAPLRILFVGGDFARKGGATLLRAFADMPGQCELHLVTRAAVEPSRGVYVYHNATPNSDLLKRLYSTADIFVLPTLGDCFSIASEEAMASSLPVITCPVGGIPEIVQHGETGLLVPPGDSRALHSAIITLVDDPARRRAMGIRGRERAERMFDNRVNARRILDVMASIAR